MEAPGVPAEDREARTPLIATACDGGLRVVRRSVLPRHAARRGAATQRSRIGCRRGAR